MRRLPPANSERNLANLLDLAPDLTDDLLSAIDQPLKIATCKQTGRQYLLCDYNRDGDSYRSPWSNMYEPALEDGAVPSAKLRELEAQANEAFDIYRELYFEGGYSSVYMWDLENNGFAATILIKKINEDSAKVKGGWDSIHVVEVSELGSGSTKMGSYKLTSTITLSLVYSKPALGKMALGGSMTRQMEQRLSLTDPLSGHVGNIGKIIEEMENKMRNTLQDIYFGKTKDIVNDLRSITSLSERKKQEQLQFEVVSGLQSS